MSKSAQKRMFIAYVVTASIAGVASLVYAVTLLVWVFTKVDILRMIDTSSTLERVLTDAWVLVVIIGPLIGILHIIVAILARKQKYAWVAFTSGAIFIVFLPLVILRAYYNL